MITANLRTLNRIPTTAQEFWDATTFPGRRAAWHDGYFEGIWSALVADGVPPSRVLTNFDLDRAFRKLNQLKPNINVWYTSGNQQEQIMLDNEVDMEYGWQGRANNLKYVDKLNCTISYQQTFAIPNYFAIPKNAPNPAGALAFMQFWAANPKRQALWAAKQGGYTTSNPQALKYMSDDQKQLLFNATPARTRQVTILNADQLAKINFASLKARWYDWLQS
jgi:putative spermidine/putrescine transport system substrate-binding protein